jgi:hypothetical protein
LTLQELLRWNIIVQTREMQICILFLLERKNGQLLSI